MFGLNPLILVVCIPHYDTSYYNTFLRAVASGGSRMTGVEGGGGGSDRASYCEPKETQKKELKKIHEPEILHPKKYLASKFTTPRNTRLKYLNTDEFNQKDFKT